MFPSLDKYSYNINNDNYGKMASCTHRHFIVCLQKPPHMRTDVDLGVIFSYLHGMEALKSLREPALRALCRTVRYEYHEANDILYCQRELSTCWYILLSGSVFIEGSMFLPRSSFGKRTPGCARRSSECLILEPSEMIVIDYPDVQMMKPGSRVGHANTMSLDRLPQYNYPDDTYGIKRMNSDTSGFSEQTIPDIQIGYNGRGNEQFEHSSRASDTSSAYSGSDVMQSSIDDVENDVNDLPCDLVESQVDSDDEEGYGESTESLPVRDSVRECLEKEPQDRTDDDIEILLDFMQHFRAFANMTLATRRALCAVMVYAVIEKAGTIVMKDGEELDSWSVILNGQVAIEKGEEVTYLQLGDSFGITPTMEKLFHQGTMHTMVDDCQFVCIAQVEYYRILHQGEENTKRHMENGQCVMITEHRVFDGGNRRGHIVIKATPVRLMQQLIEDHSVVDPTYVEDFLLTYRTFLPSPMLLANKLLQWFEDTALRAKVTRVVLLWVNNHFNDFEMNADMTEFLEHFEDLLEREKMTGQLHLLNLACASKARPRTATLTRATRDEILYFQILGGVERGCGIFIKKVERISKAFEAGLKRGDQILEVNGQSFLNISHNKALELLRKTTHLSITVKSNLLEFKEMLEHTEKNSALKRQDFANTNNKQRLSAPDLENALLPVPTHKKKNTSKKDNKGLMVTLASSKPKIRKALRNLIPHSSNNSSLSSNPSLNHSDENISSHLSRKSSTSSGSSSSNIGLSDHLSASNPDLSSFQLGVEEKTTDFPEHVVKVYRSDQSFKYLLIHKETTAKEVVMLSLREFGVTDPSSNYSLCEVTVESEGFIKQKRLPETLQNLPDRLTLNGRYYLKNNMSTEPLVPDELMGDLIKEAQIGLLQLNALEVASQLTLEDFKVFKEIQDTEYIDEIFHLKSKFGCPNLKRFEELVNKEMFWVVTEICNEMNLVKRMKVMKHFIKIARHCKDCKNFNSMFAIVSGLQHSSVSRLHNTWEKVPNKYKKMYEGMYVLMDPSRNMSKYRNLLSSQFVLPPMLPFFPVFKKDLTFVDLGNDSIVEGLVNFEKLRMIAKEIRHICNMCSTQYDVSTMYLGTPSMYNNNSMIFGVATIKRTKNKRTSAVPNARKMYEEAQMTRRVKSYLGNLPSIRDEDKLAEQSYQCEPPAKRAESTSNMSTSQSNIAIEDKKPVAYTEPKFGADTMENTRKLMALSGKIRPHDSKNILPSITSPNLSGGRRPPVSPRHSRQPVHLTSESSSVISLSNIANRKPCRTGSMGSRESHSPTNSIKSNHSAPPAMYESDCNHSSIPTCDNHSQCVGRYIDSPPLSRKSSLSNHHPPRLADHHHQPLQSASESLPACPQTAVCLPLPSYHIVMQNAQANSHYIHTTYTNVHRPPLPDYHMAKHLAQVARQRHTLWSGTNMYYRDEEFGQMQGNEDEEDEQVSAV